jgi:hypothetical protein
MPGRVCVSAPGEEGKEGFFFLKEKEAKRTSFFWLRVWHRRGALIE